MKRTAPIGFRHPKLKVVLLTAAGSILLGYYHEALGHLFLDWLLRWMPETWRETLVSMTPFVVFCSLAAYFGYIAGQHGADTAAADTYSAIDNLKEEVSTLRRQNDTLLKSLQNASAENIRLKHDFEEAVGRITVASQKESELLDEIADFELTELKDRIYGCLASGPLSEYNILKKCNNDAPDKVRAAIGQLTSEGKITQGALQGDLKRAYP
jgi:hypothetical protein